MRRCLLLFFTAAAPLVCQSVINGTNWFPIGPAPIINGQTYGSGRVDVTGRASVIAVNPMNANDVWLGTANGGVWHSTDAGVKWTPMSDQEESLAIGAIALDGCNASECATVYAGTGENAIRRDTYYGAGLLIGETSGGEFPQFLWTQRGAAIFKPGTITKVVLDPGTSGANKRVFVALSGGVTASATESTVSAPAPPTGYGVFRSDDKGVNWAKLNIPGSNGAKVTDLEMDPGNSNVLYAGILGRGIFKTTDGGTTWCPLNPGIAVAAGCVAVTGLPDPGSNTFDHVEIAIFPGNSSILYATLGACPSLIKDSCGAAVYKSSNAGAMWTQMRAADSSGGLSSACPRGYSRYSHALVTHPTISTTLLVGADEVCQSTDSGANFAPLGTDSVHPDHHALVFPNPSNPSLIYDTNDGGFAISMNGGNTWISRVTDLQITGFQSVASSPLTGKIIGGTQDNGTEMWTGSRVWQHVHDGDTGFNIMDRDNVMTMYDTNFSVSASQSTTGGGLGSWGGFTTGLNFNDPSAFYPPFVQDPSAPYPLYYGTNRLYKRFKTDAIWSAVSPVLGGTGVVFPDINTTNVITAIAVAPTDANRIYIGYYDGQMFYTNGACDLAACWTVVLVAANGLPNQVVTRIAVDPSSANTAYATYSGFNIGAHVFKTTDGGASWTAASGAGATALPDIPINTISIEPSAPSNLWIGTDRGVYKSTNGGTTWNKFSNGLPNVSVYEISIDETHGRVYAATHGRGMFVLTRPFLTNYEGWVDGGIWDIPVFGHGFLPNQNCTMRILRQDGTDCAIGSVDAMGGNIRTDGTGQLVTSNGGFYIDKPVAWACFNGTCLGGANIAACNQPGNRVSTVIATCGGLVGVDNIVGCPQLNNPPSSLMGLSGLPPTGGAALSATRAAGVESSFDLIASVQSGDGTTRALCSATVPFQSTDTRQDIITRTASTLNSTQACMARTVTASVRGIPPPGDPLEEDAPVSDPRLEISAPGVNGGQLITSVHAAPGRATSVCFVVSNLGVPVINSTTIMRLRIETGTGGAAGGTIAVTENSPLGVCAVTAATPAGGTPVQVANAIAAAFQAAGDPGPNPRCPARQNPRDIIADGDSVVSVVASALTVCVNDGNVGFVIAPEELALDTIAPTTVATANPPANVNGWNNTSVTVTFNATDNPGGSGVKNVQYTLSGAQGSGPQVVNGNTASVTINNEGITVITYFASDNFGNQETPKTLTVRIDRTPPLVGGLPAPGFCTLWPPDHRMVSVGATMAVDFISGPDPSSYTVMASSNEPNSGTGVGDLSPDIMISGVSVQLRAERSDSGTGRVYTITGTARDLAGNLGTCTVVCNVPLK